MVLVGRLGRGKDENKAKLRPTSAGALAELGNKITFTHSFIIH